MAFAYRDGVLHAEQVSLEDLARQFGTPCYVYSRAAIERAYREYADELADRPSLVCYSVKANSNLAVLSVMAQLGAGFDIVSGGELARVIAAGGDLAKVVFSGIGKSEIEIRDALQAGVLSINLESEQELARVNGIAIGMGKRRLTRQRAANHFVDHKADIANAQTGVVKRHGRFHGAGPVTMGTPVPQRFIATGMLHGDDNITVSCPMLTPQLAALTAAPQAVREQNHRKAGIGCGVPIDHAWRVDAHRYIAFPGSIAPGCIAVLNGKRTCRRKRRCDTSHLGKRRVLRDHQCERAACGHRLQILPRRRQFHFHFFSLSCSVASAHRHFTPARVRGSCAASSFLLTNPEQAR